MEMDEKAVLDLLVARISAHQAVRRIILFGSRASGRSNAESDFDLCVLIDPQADRRRTYIELMREISSADYSVDLMLLADGEFELKLTEGWSVIRAVHENGKTLYAA